MSCCKTYDNVNYLFVLDKYGYFKKFNKALSEGNHGYIKSLLKRKKAIHIVNHTENFTTMLVPVDSQKELEEVADIYNKPKPNN